MFTEFSRGGEKLWVSVCAIMRQVLITFCLQMTRCYSSKKMEVGVQSICKIFYLCVRIAQGRSWTRASHPSCLVETQERMSKATFMSAMDIKSEASNGKYLGLPVYMGKSKVQTFTYLNERVWKRIQGWKDKLLSRVGKAVLIKATAQAIPTYAMSCFDLTNAVFAWLWLMAGTDLLWENSTADWLVTGGWCWFSMREQYCWLVGW